MDRTQTHDEFVDWKDNMTVLVTKTDCVYGINIYDQRLDLIG